MTTHIYILLNSLGRYFYVGKSKCPTERLRKHKKDYGKDIKMDIVDSVNSFKKEDWEPLETKWIDVVRSWGYPITNKRKKGGSGPEGYLSEQERYDNQMACVKQYHHNNKEKIKITQDKYNHQYYLDNKEKIKEQTYKYSKNRPPHVEANRKAYMKEYNYKRNHPQA